MSNRSATLRRVLAASALAVCWAAVQPASAQQAPAGQTSAKKAPASKAAQPKGPWTGRAFISLDGGVQVTASPITSHMTFTLHAENATVDASSDGAVGPVFTARGGLRLWRSLAAGVGVTAFWSSPDVAVTATLPHPFYFNKPRSLEGEASGLTHNETMVAAELSWMVPLSRRIDMNLFGGPAFFNLRKDMVTKVLFTETYPYDTATFTGVESVSASDSPVGFTAGADVSYRLSRRFGIGGQLRYSHATANLTVNGQSTAVEVGGLQVGGGLRIRF